MAANKTNIRKSPQAKTFPHKDSIRTGDLLYKGMNNRVFIVADVMGEHVIIELESGQQFPFKQLGELVFAKPHIIFTLSPNSDPTQRDPS
jgi:hypothetical protein